jgi:hypothetical protein
LPAANTGEQPGLLDVDPGIDERRGQMLREIFEVVGEFLARDGGVVEQVDLVDFTDRRSS